MIVESEVGVESFSPATTTKVVYDDGFPIGSSSLLGESESRLRKRSGVLPNLMLASTLAFTTSALSMPAFEVVNATRLPISDQFENKQSSRRITLRQAHEMALLAHRAVEDGLQKDRIQESRLMNFEENEHEA